MLIIITTALLQDFVLTYYVKTSRLGMIRIFKATILLKKVMRWPVISNHRHFILEHQPLCTRLEKTSILQMLECGIKISINSLNLLTHDLS